MEVLTGPGYKLVHQERTSASIVSHPSDVASKAIPKESGIFYDQSNYKLDEPSSKALEEAANYLANDSSAE